MMNHSDLEELLEEAPAERQWNFPKRVAIVVTTVALAGVALFSVRGNGLRSKSSEFVTLEEQGCFEWGKFYAHPNKLPGTERTVEMNAEACQQRCQVVDGCAHFTFWPDGGCLLTGDDATAQVAPAKYASTVYGPRFCQSAINAATAQIDSAAEAQDSAESSGLVSGTGTSGLVGGTTGGTSGLVGGTTGGSSGLVGTSGLVVDTPTLAPATASGTSGLVTDTKGVALGAEATWTNSQSDKISIAAGEITEMLPGVNGTQCSAYPACVAASMTGECCPNADKVQLGCCNGFPKTALPVIPEGTGCSMFPACVALNITGACCPTPEGIKLGCCTQI